MATFTIGRQKKKNCGSSGFGAGRWREGRPQQRTEPAKSPSPGGEPRAAILAESGPLVVDISAVCEDFTMRFQAVLVLPKPPSSTLKERTSLERKFEGLNKRIDKHKARAVALEQEVQLKRTELAKLSDELAGIQTEADGAGAGGENSRFASHSCSRQPSPGHPNLSASRLYSQLRVRSVTFSREPRLSPASKSAPRRVVRSSCSRGQRIECGCCGGEYRHHQR